MLMDYVPILFMMSLAFAFGAFSLLMSFLMGPKRPNPQKLSAYECGMPPVGDARERFSVKFYITAMLFIVFDLETVFLYPWAVVFRKLGMYGFVEMFIFLAVLFIGYIYVWQKGALRWD